MFGSLYQWITVFAIWCSIVGTVMGRKYECVKVDATVCRNLEGNNGYAFTSFPNFLNQSTQLQAIADLSAYKPLMNSNCAKELSLFLCATYIPICQPEFNTFRIAPCRSLCEASKHGCEPVLQKFGFEWPKELDCKQFPEQNEGKVCVRLPGKPTKTQPTSRPGFVKVRKDETINFQCRHNMKIYIKKVRHHPKHLTCCPLVSKAIISNMCNGKEKCSVTLTEEVFGYSCHHDVSELLLKFKCARANAIVPTKIRVPTCKKKNVVRN